MPTSLLTKKAVEYKNFHFELKAVNEDEGIVEGYLSTFGNVDYQKDRVVKGAFKKTLLEAKSRMQNKGKKYLWPVLWMHDPEKPLGGCVEAKEDDYGLYTKFQLDITKNEQGIPNNPLATMVFSGYKNGYIDEQSMGYKAIQKEYDEGGVRNLKECQIWEESCVTSLFAADPEAQATQVKSIYNEQKEKIGYIDTDEEGNDRFVLFDKKDASNNETKDFNSHYSDAMARDVLEDWYDLMSSLKYASMDLFTIGDQPLEDAKAALEQFGTAYLAWIQRGIDTNLSDYLAAQIQSQTPSYGYSYSSRSDMPDFKHYIDQLQKERLGIKKGARVSKETADKVGGHVDALNGMAEQHKAMADQCKDMISQHKLAMKTLSTVADDLSAVIGRVAYDADQDENEEADAARNGKSREPRANAALTQQPDNTTVNELAQFQAWLEAKTSK